MELLEGSEKECGFRCKCEHILRTAAFNRKTINILKLQLIKNIKQLISPNIIKKSYKEVIRNETRYKYNKTFKKEII